MIGCSNEPDIGALGLRLLSHAKVLTTVLHDPQQHRLKLRHHIAQLIQKQTASLRHSDQSFALLHARIWKVLAIPKQQGCTEAAAAAIVRKKDTTMPSPQLVEKYEKGYAKFKQFYPALKGKY